jgi:general secretion pathway protein G
MDKIGLDPWDNEYRFAAPGKHNTEGFDVWSVGPDGQDGSADDIGNWDNKTS